MSERADEGTLAVWLGAAWALTAFVSYANPGDEYGLFVVSSVLGMWVALPLGVFGGGMQEAVLPLAVAGGATVWGLVWAGLRLGGSRRLVLAAWGVLGGLVLFGLLRDFESLDEATQKNGSLMAYLAAASNIGLTLATLVGLVWGGVRWVAGLGERRG